MNNEMQRFARLVEAELDKIFPLGNEKWQNVTDACRHSLLGGGKRLRPALLMEFYAISGGKDDVALPFACALEMIHTYSLIHDDLPCMDNDDMRRGKPSCHVAFGYASALLAGDALLTCAFETMLKPCGIRPQQAMRAALFIAQSAGICGMIGGQAMDLAFEKAKPTAEEHSQMVSLKTGALIRAACVAGAILAGGEAKTVKVATKYGEDIGRAFQIEDDLLDIFGDTQKLGKKIGSDESNSKSTFVTIYGKEWCINEVQRLTDAAIQSASQLPRGDELKKLATELASRSF